MNDEYNFRNMKRVPHPLQHKIDNGMLRLRSPFDISDEDFQTKLELLDEGDREFALECRELWMKKQQSSRLCVTAVTVSGFGELLLELTDIHGVPHPIKIYDTVILSNGLRFHVLKWGAYPNIDRAERIIAFVEANENDIHVSDQLMFT
jgi:hypothetical protein